MIRKGMLLHLQRNGLESDGFAANSSHPLRKMLFESSLEVNVLFAIHHMMFPKCWFRL
jgi:hypothetical protein